MTRKPGPYDSHPSPAQRLTWARALAVEVPARADDAAPAWSLFDDREALEERMTREVRDSVAESHGIVIPAGGGPTVGPGC